MSAWICVHRSKNRKLLFVSLGGHCLTLQRSLEKLCFFGLICTEFIRHELYFVVKSPSCQKNCLFFNIVFNCLKTSMGKYFDKVISNLRHFFFLNVFGQQFNGTLSEKNLVTSYAVYWSLAVHLLIFCRWSRVDKSLFDHMGAISGKESFF